MPVIIAGNDQQKKKYLGRMTEEPLMCVSICRNALFNTQEGNKSAISPFQSICIYWDI